MKLSRRAGRIVFVLLVAFFMAGAISFTLTFIRAGYTPGFVTLWLRHWTFAFLAAVPTGFIVIPAVRALVDSLSR